MVELAHWGVLGMQWGVRKDRRSNDMNRATDLLSNRQALSETSLKDLQDLASRLDLERRLRTHVSEADEAGKGFVSKFIDRNKNALLDKAVQSTTNLIVGYATKKLGFKNELEAIRAMTDDQLKTANSRLELESTYKHLTDKLKGKKKD